MKSSEDTPDFMRRASKLAQDIGDTAHGYAKTGRSFARFNLFKMQDADYDYDACLIWNDMSTQDWAETRFLQKEVSAFNKRPW